MSFVLDTNVVLYHLGNRLAEGLPAGPICISIISEMELLSYPGLSDSEEKRIAEFLAKVNVIDLSEAIKNDAIMLRRAHRLKLPDAIIAATAKALKASLITNDAVLAKIEEIEVVGISLNLQ